MCEVVFLKHTYQIAGCEMIGIVWLCVFVLILFSSVHFEMQDPLAKFSVGEVQLKSSTITMKDAKMPVQPRWCWCSFIICDFTFHFGVYCQLSHSCELTAFEIFEKLAGLC